MKKKNLLIAILIILGLILLLVLLRRCAKQGPGAKGGKPLNDTVDLNAVFAEIEDVMKKDEPEESEMDNEIDYFEEIEVNPDESNMEEPALDEVNTESNEPATNETKKATPKTWTDEEEIDFGEFSFLTKKAIVKTDDNKVNEVWMVKLTDLSQQEAVARIFAGRVARLKEAFHDQQEQLEVLENAVIKQEDGIMIAIISPSVNKLESVIADAMK